MRNETTEDTSIEQTKTRKKQTTLKILVNKIDEGLRLIAGNIRRFVRDIDALLGSGRSDWHAIALAIFAFEELGKYHKLKEAKQAAEGDIVTIDEALFTDHNYKQEIAKGLLPRDALTILPRIVVPNVDGTTHVLTHSVKVSPLLRLDCLFVDWKNDDWNLGSPENPDHVRKFIQAIVDALVRMEKIPL
jgi:AbiV family abortive infection protein